LPTGNSTAAASSSKLSLLPRIRFSIAVKLTHLASNLDSAQPITTIEIRKEEKNFGA
jgi:hypothetical protein